MNKVIKGIATAMIIILIVLLIWIFLAYYRDSAFIDTIVFPSGDVNASNPSIPSEEYVSNEGKNIINGNGLIESIIGEKNTQNDSLTTSGDIKIEKENNSGDNENIYNPTESSGDNTPDTIIQIPSINEEENNTNEQIMISSNTQTSNQEKQEILSEIDEALQGLLEAVGKIETVDETRLEATLNSEVGKP